MTVTASALFQSLPSDVDLAYLTLTQRINELYRSSDTIDDKVMAEALIRFCQRFDIAPNERQLEEGYSNFFGFHQAHAEQRRNQKILSHQYSQIDEELDRIDSAMNSDRFGYAHLNDDEKRFILSQIESIRDKIQSSAVAERKKQALLKRLLELSAEVAKDYTKTDRFFALLGDLASVGGEMAEKAKPAMDDIKEILRIVMNSRSAVEAIAPPRNDEYLALPSANEASE